MAISSIQQSLKLLSVEETLAFISCNKKFINAVKIDTSHHRETDYKYIINFRHIRIENMIKLAEDLEKYCQRHWKLSIWLILLMVGVWF